MTIVPNRPGFSLRDLAAILGVMAVMMRAIIAPGLMPDLNAAAHGDLSLVICSAGELKALLPAEDQEPNTGHRGTQDRCFFAAFGHLAALSAKPPVISAPTSFDVVRLPYPEAQAAPTIQSAYARAPPLV